MWLLATEMHLDHLDWEAPNPGVCRDRLFPNSAEEGPSLPLSGFQCLLASLAFHDAQPSTPVSTFIVTGPSPLVCLLMRTPCWVRDPPSSSMPSTHYSTTKPLPSRVTFEVLGYEFSLSFLENIVQPLAPFRGPNSGSIAPPSDRGFSNLASLWAHEGSKGHTGDQEGTLKVSEAD